MIKMNKIINKMKIKNLIKKRGKKEKTVAIKHQNIQHEMGSNILKLKKILVQKRLNKVV